MHASSRTAHDSAVAGNCPTKSTEALEVCIEEIHITKGFRTRAYATSAQLKEEADLSG